MKLPVYLDNHATTPVDQRVLDKMLPFFTENFGNAASRGHPYGWRAREAVEEAREQAARLAGCEPGEIIFTSGATESINLVLKGIARKRAWSEIRIVTCVTEHSAVLDTCLYLESLGAKVMRLSVNRDGMLDLGVFESAIERGVDLVSLMHANNEIGTIHPIAEIARICRAHNVMFHVDAAQSFGKIPIRFRDDKVDFMSISGHKLYAPKGVGALIIRRKTPPLRLTPLIHGGGHERGFRSGTLNVPGIVALGAAADICAVEMGDEARRLKSLRDLLIGIIQNGLPDVVVNGTMEDRLPGNLNVSIPGIEGQLLLPALRDHISVSSGSACTSADPKPSHVLSALGVSDALSQASLRFGVGRFNSESEIRYAADTVVRIAGELRH